MKLNDLTKEVIGSAIEVHKILGPGLLESVYERCLLYELKKKDLDVKSQLILPVTYKDIDMEYGYRIDLLVENSLVVELKTVDYLMDVHYAQTLTYMKLGQYKLGLLINFKVKLLKDGIKRLIL